MSFTAACLWLLCHFQGTQAWSGPRQGPGPFMAEEFSDHSLNAHLLWVITASRPFCGKNQELYI